MTTPTPTDTLRDRIAAALVTADGHSCAYQEGTDHRALADAVLPLVAGEQTAVSDEHMLRLTPQSCPAGIHADWAVDSEHDHACPWCEIDRLRARADAEDGAR